MTFENKALNIIKQFFISQLLQINLPFIIWTLGHTSFKTSSKHQPRRLKNVNFRKSNFDRYARVKNALELHPSTKMLPSVVFLPMFITTAHISNGIIKPL